MSTYSNKVKHDLSGALETTEPFDRESNARCNATMKVILSGYSGQAVSEVIEDIENLGLVRYPTREERMERRVKRALLTATLIGLEGQIIGGNGNGQDHPITTHEIPTHEEASKSRRVPSLVLSPRP